MTIHLATNDPELDRRCRELLAEIPELGPWNVVAAPPEAGWREADVHVWDFHPAAPIPELTGRNAGRHLVLVDRKDLPVFRARRDSLAVQVLLKPVTRRMLAAFLVPSVPDAGNGDPLSDREEILHSLMKTNLNLQERDQERTSFVACAVHDLQTPLSTLNGYCGLLLSGSLGGLTESEKDVLRRMQNSAQRLSRMASAMVDLSAGEPTKRRPDLRRGDLRECLEQAIEEITPFADEKGISITPEFSQHGDELLFESGQIEQVLAHILDNACKFTPKGGAIEVRGYPYFWERRRTPSSCRTGCGERRLRAVCEDNSYRVDISHTGARIPGDQLDRIFDQFAYTGSRERSGGGLALAICRMIITNHDGRIWAENRDLGPVFSFVLPMRPLEDVLTGFRGPRSASARQEA